MIVLKIITIRLSLPFGSGGVNCYLLRGVNGYVLIDTAYSSRRPRLDKEIEAAGCHAGDLRLILLTHGDFDHSGNAAHVARRFGARIAMHRDDAGMVERGNIFWNRKPRNFFVTRAAALLFRFNHSDRFSPDLFVDDGDSLSDCGVDATILHLPGHSRGSIAVITGAGDLFCGDLLVGKDQPALNSIIDDPAAARASVDRLRQLKIRTVYPGHGRPFTMDRIQ